MKIVKFFSILSFIILISCSDTDSVLVSSNVVPQISIQSQEDLDNTNFSKIDTIQGPLTIRNTSIRDLSFLSEICVAGIIEIFGNESLISLNGIEKLSCVTSLIIAQNGNLNNIEALSNLEISENLNIRNNGLEQVNPITSLKNISNQIFINEPNLESYRLFQNLTKINSLVLGGSLAQNLDDFINLKEIGSELRIFGNHQLNDYCGMKDALINSSQISFETFGNQTNPSLSQIVDDCE